MTINNLKSDFQTKKTPFAVSTISSDEISLKTGNQEFAGIMNKIPGIYSHIDSGGFGESQVSLRGFGHKRTNLLINGQYVNNAQGEVYWSNWQLLSDAATHIEIQRGLGDSQLPFSGVGGTISISSKPSEKIQGIKVNQIFGNDGYNRTVFTYNTGASEQGWASSFLVSKQQGDGYANNTSGKAYSFFGAVEYKPQDSDHEFNFTVLGTGQWHNIRYKNISIRDYENFGDSGIDTRWNTNGGTLNGEPFNIKKNFYTKPIGTFNWDWTINDKIKLKTSLYGSLGKGGNTGPRGRNYIVDNIDYWPFRDDLTEHTHWPEIGSRLTDGTIDFDVAVNSNKSTGPYTGSLTEYQGKKIGAVNTEVGLRDVGINRLVLIVRSSINNRNIFGGTTNLEYQNDKFKTSINADFKIYEEHRYRVVNNLLGLDGFYDFNYRLDPNRIIDTIYPSKPLSSKVLKKQTDIDNTISYNEIQKIESKGLNGKIEYSDNKYAVTMSVGANNYEYQYINNYMAKPNKKTYSDLNSGYVKLGAKYLIDNDSTLFLNTGIISQQPRFNRIFPNSSLLVADFLENDRVTSTELGYTLDRKTFSLKINAYSTNSLIDAIVRVDFEPGEGNEGYGLFEIKSLHKGLECEGEYRLSDKSNFRIAISIGDWKYTNDSIMKVFVDNNELSTAIYNDEINKPEAAQHRLHLDDIKVPGTAQSTVFLGFKTNITDEINMDIDYRFVDRLYASDFQPDFTNYMDVRNRAVSENPDYKGPIKLPSYDVLDLGITTKISKDLGIRVNINNVLNKTYIVNSPDLFTRLDLATDDPKWRGINKKRPAWFGFKRNWNVKFVYDQ